MTAEPHVPLICLMHAENFDDTREYHRGSVTLAARRLGLKPESLRRALNRARKRGWTGTFISDTKGQR